MAGIGFAIKRYWRRLKKSGVSAGFVLLLAFIISLLLYNNRRDILLYAIQVFAVWTPLLVIIKLPTLIKHWRRVLVVVISLGLSLLVVWWMGSTILSKMGLPIEYFDLCDNPIIVTGVTNKDGVQPNVSSKNYDEAGFNIIFLGDSYTYGAGLEDKRQSFPFVVEKQLQDRFPNKAIRVANFGWRATGPFLQEKKFRTIAADYHPVLVVHAIDMSDFSNDYEHHARMQEMASGMSRRISVFRALIVRFSMLLGVRDFTLWLPQRIGKKEKEEKRVSVWPGEKFFFHMQQPLAKSEPLMGATWQAIMKTYKYSRKLNAEYCLVVLPRCEHYDRGQCPPNDGVIMPFPKSDEFIYEPFKYFEKRAQTSPFPIHSLLPDFQSAGASSTVFSDDPHYNENGHRIAGEAIIRYLIADGVFLK